MLKIQFKRKKPVVEQNLFHPSAYENQYTEQPFGQEFSHENVFTPEPTTPVQTVQEIDTCLFCGSEITGAHLSVTTKSGEHCVHTSCIVSSFALLLNGVGYLFSWLRERKGRR